MKVIIFAAILLFSIEKQKNLIAYCYKEKQTIRIALRENFTHQIELLTQMEYKNTYYSKGTYYN